MAVLDTVPFSEVRAFVSSLGADVDDVVSVELGPNSVTVEQFRRDRAGQLIDAGDGVATVTTVIGYDRSA